MVEVGRLGQDTFDLVLSLHTVNLDGFREKFRNILRVQSSLSVLVGAPRKREWYLCVVSLRVSGIFAGIFWRRRLLPS